MDEARGVASFADEESVVEPSDVMDDVVGDGVCVEEDAEGMGAILELGVEMDCELDDGMSVEEVVDAAEEDGSGVVDIAEEDGSKGCAVGVMGMKVVNRIVSAGFVATGLPFRSEKTSSD
jgi:hypothetical protein